MALFLLKCKGFCYLSATGLRSTETLSMAHGLGRSLAKAQLSSMRDHSTIRRHRFTPRRTSASQPKVPTFTPSNSRGQPPAKLLSSLSERVRQHRSRFSQSKCLARTPNSPSNRSRTACISSCQISSPSNRLMLSALSSHRGLRRLQSNFCAGYTDSHRSGRPSGDQFAVYVCDRLICSDEQLQGSYEYRN